MYSGRSSVLGEEMKSDSQKPNESYSRMQRERGEGNISASFSDGFFLAERDINIYQQFSKGARKRSLGGLYKVKFLDDEKAINY
jgi:predicted RNA-binding protein (virulence factor B family)